MKIYYNDNYISIDEYAIHKKRTIPYMLRKFNKGEIPGLSIGGIRLCSKENPTAHWYHYGMEDEKIYLPERPKILVLENMITVQNYAHKVNRMADAVYDLILNRKMQCCIISGIVFVDRGITIHQELLEISGKKDHIHKRRQ